MWRALAIGALLGACYAPAPPEGRPCGDGDTCPAELVCRGGFCVRDGETGFDAATDAEPIVDALDALDAPDAPMIDAPADAAMAACPAGYVAITGQASKYRTVTTAQTWTAAEADCENDGVGTHLAVIDSMAEHTAVDALTGASIWFGLTDRVVEGTLRWVTGATPAYNHTTTVANTDAYDCAGIYQGNWAWGQCTTLINYVCECDGLPAQAGAY
jgi:hypothetical protein